MKKKKASDMMMTTKEMKEEKMDKMPSKVMKKIADEMHKGKRKK